MCSGVSGRCAPADCQPQSWWVRYTSIPPRAQMAADGAFLPLIGDRRLLKIAPYLRFAIPAGIAQLMRSPHSFPRPLVGGVPQPRY
jgi:hypothetical protein